MPVAEPRPAIGWWLAQLLRFVIGLALVAAVTAAAVAFYQYMVKTRVATTARPSLERARPVDAVVVTPGTVRPGLRLFGQIVAGRTVDLRVLVGGEVKEVSPRLGEGGRVEAGEVLVVVDPFEYEGALVRARVELAEAEARIAETEARIRLEQDGRDRASEQRDMAQRETDRFSTLQGRGVTSGAALDASKSRLAAAMAATEARQNQIRVLEAQLVREKAAIDRLRWNVTKAERDITNTRLLAPFTGVASNVAAEIGRLLNVSDRVATVTDLERLEVRFTLTDAQYARLSTSASDQPAAHPLVGTVIEIVWGPEEGPVKATGRIARVSPAITASTGGVDVIATIDAGAGTRRLRPGAFVNVLAPDVPYTDVVALPQGALHPGGRAFIIGADGRLVPVSIDLVGYDGERALVRGSFAAGSRVLATRLPDAGPGLLVQPR